MDNPEMVAAILTAGMVSSPDYQAFANQAGPANAVAAKAAVELYVAVLDELNSTSAAAPKATP